MGERENFLDIGGNWKVPRSKDHLSCAIGPCSNVCMLQDADATAEPVTGRVDNEGRTELALCCKWVCPHAASTSDS